MVLELIGGLVGGFAFIVLLVTIFVGVIWRLKAVEKRKDRDYGRMGHHGGNLPYAIR